jgi:recombination protein RecA
MGIDVVYFDSESALDPDFLEGAGCDVEKLIYVQAQSVEFVLENIEQLLSINNNRMLFIWDSLALTPAIGDIEGDFNPQSSMALKARVLAKGMSKLLISIADSQSTLLVLNQLKTNITRNVSETMTTPYVTPGGKALIYAYSLRIWLTGRKAKASFIEDEHGFRIGSEVKVRLEKSRFGTAGRQCAFKILWGGQVGIQDEQSWLEAIRGSSSLKNSGAWYRLDMADGTEVKFQKAGWVDKLQDPKFRQRVMDIMDEEVILKFEKRQGKAEDFYDVDKETEKSTDS